MDWPQLVREHVITGVADTTAYALPADFRSLVSDTAWSRTNDQTIRAPTAQGWNTLKASSLGATLSLQARILSDRASAHADQVQFITAPAADESLAFEYRSRSWVRTAANAYADAPTAATDVVLFDPLLAVRALKLAFRREKGLDTTSAQQDFDASLAACRGDLIIGQTLSLVGGSDGPHLIDIRNLPETGYGS